MSSMDPCPVCRGYRTQPFLRRMSVPVCQNFLAPTFAAAQSTPKGDLRLCACHFCGFVFNAAFDLGVMEYGQSYENTQACSPTFVDYLDKLAHYLVFEKGLRGKRVIEIGCGKGLFLRRLALLDVENRYFHGFDPSYAGPLEDLGGRVHFSQSYYTEESAVVNADAIVCRHVIEHVPDPVRLLDTIRLALASAKAPQLFFETPCVEWILRNRAFYDFFYEHCSYFSANSLRTAFERAAFSVVDVRHVFGGQYLWLEADAGSAEAGARDAGAIVRMATSYGLTEEQLVRSWQEQTRKLARAGKLVLWGAGAKGTTFAAIVDPDRELLAGVVDVNPAKQGCFIPGTGHPILPPDAIRKQGVQSVLVMNPNYRAEIEAALRSDGSDAAVLDVSQLEACPT